MNQPLEWGHIPGSTWARAPGSTFGYGIVRPKARWNLVDIAWPDDYAPGGNNLLRWRMVGDDLYMDLGIADVSLVPCTLQELVDHLHSAPPTFVRRDARVEQFNYVLDRFLWLLNHLVESKVPIGLVSPISIRLVVRDNLDYCRVAELSKRNEKSLNFNDRELMLRAQLGREIVLTDLGLIQALTHSSEMSCFRKDDAFAFLWLPDPATHHRAILNEQEAIAFSVRLIAWLLAKTKVTKIPNIEVLAQFGPCWKVLAAASAGNIQTIEEFRRALQANPPGAHAFGKEVPASYFTQRDDLVVPSKVPTKPWPLVLIAILVAMSILGLAAFFLFSKVA